MSVSITADRVDDAGRLLGSRCPACDITGYPAFELCPRCWQPTVDQPLSAVGNLYAYSVVHIGPAGRPVPYTVAYVDVPEGARLFAHLEETEESRLHSDRSVRLNLQPDGDRYAASWRTEPADA